MNNQSSEKTMLELSLPESFPLSVVMQQTRVTTNIWQTIQWSAIGVIVGERHTSNGEESELILQDEHSAQHLHPGYRIRLHKDECESYYYNLIAESPQIYIVCRTDEVDKLMRPMLVSASYDEAAAYHESDNEVYTVPMPAELYNWIEAYVLQHYQPEKKRKRKLTDWKEERPQDGPNGMLCND